MNKNTIIFINAVIVSLLMSGCAQKVRVKALNPAEVGEMASSKKIAITSFKNDRVGLSGKIESLLAQHKLDKERYFTVLSRKHLNEVLKEQKLQSSELMDERTSSRVGKIIGAQAIINGEVAVASSSSDKYTEKRKRCLKYVKDEGCVRYEYYYVVCNTTTAQLSANINIVDIQTGSLIYGDTISKSYSGDSCRSRVFLSQAQAISQLSSDVSTQFVRKLTPHYVYYDVELLDSIEVSATSEDKDKLKYSLEYMKANRMDKAEKILTSIMDSIDGRSYVVAYNLGVAKEALGKLDEAKKLYDMADNLTLEPVDEINIAVRRIAGSIDKRDEAKRQLSAK